MGLFSKFPINAVIFEERGGEGKFLIVEDKGRRIYKKDTGDYYYQLKKKKARTPPVPYDAIYLLKDVKGNTKQYVFLYSLTPFTFFPIKFNEEMADALFTRKITKEQILTLLPFAIEKEVTPDLKAKILDDESWQYWHTQTIKQNVVRTQYKSTLDKFLPIMMVATLGIVIGIILYMSIGQMQVVSSGFNSAATQMIEVSKHLEEVARLMAGGSPSTTPPF